MSNSIVGIDLLRDLSKDELIDIIVDDAKNWLAHDGLWFQAVEATHGMDAAMDADREAWRHFSKIEAKRIMSRLSLKSDGGIPALVTALNHRLYARLNQQDCIEVTGNRAVFRMLECRVQSARERKAMPHFPCKSIGIVEYQEFAKTIDPRIETRCIQAPPDSNGDGDFHCAWEFTIANKIASKELN